MKQRIYVVLLALFLAGVATLFGAGAGNTFIESKRYSDYERWIQTPGKLESLALWPTLHRARWQVVVACDYSYDFAAKRYASTTFGLDRPVFATIDEAKAAVESVLNIAGRAQWRAVQQGTFDGWALDSKDLQVTVRHSPRDPMLATLTSTPPMPIFLDWVVIAVLSSLALATGLGSIALLGATFFPSE